jgi:hypothetical protein
VRRALKLVTGPAQHRDQVAVGTSCGRIDPAVMIAMAAAFVNEIGAPGARQLRSVSPAGSSGGNVWHRYPLSGESVDVAAGFHPPQRHRPLLVIDHILDAESRQVRRVDATQVTTQLGADTVRVVDQWPVDKLDHSPRHSLG